VAARAVGEMPGIAQTNIQLRIVTSLHFSPTIVAADVRRRMDRASTFSASSRRRLQAVVS